MTIASKREAAVKRGLNAVEQAERIINAAASVNRDVTTAEQANVNALMRQAEQATLAAGIAKLGEGLAAPVGAGPTWGAGPGNAFVASEGYRNLIASGILEAHKPPATSSSTAQPVTRSRVHGQQRRRHGAAGRSWSVEGSRPAAGAVDACRPVRPGHRDGRRDPLHEGDDAQRSVRHGHRRGNRQARCGVRLRRRDGAAREACRVHPGVRRDARGRPGGTEPHQQPPAADGGAGSRGEARNPAVRGCWSHRCPGNAHGWLGFDALAAGINELQTNDFFEPDGLFIHPDDYLVLRIDKDGNEDYYGSGPWAPASVGPWASARSCRRVRPPAPRSSGRSSKARPCGDAAGRGSRHRTAIATTSERTSWRSVPSSGTRSRPTSPKRSTWSTSPEASRDSGEPELTGVRASDEAPGGAPAASAVFYLRGSSRIARKGEGRAVPSFVCASLSPGWGSHGLAERRRVNAGGRASPLGR